MSEKLRGAIFSALGELDGLNVLDAYAGSGACGLEALSRNAKSITFVEPDDIAYRTLQTNLSLFSDSKDRFKSFKSTIEVWLSKHDLNFDVIITDPPYAQVNPKTIIELAQRLTPNGVMVISLPADHKLIIPQQFRTIKQKTYGDASLVYLVRVN